MAAVDDSVIAGKIIALFGDNTNKEITEADLREVTNDLNDSKANKTYVDALVLGLWDDRGNFDASVNAYPSSGGSGTSGAILKGDIWTISVPGTLPTGLIVKVGDTVRALVNTPGNTQANWAINISAKVAKDSTASSAPTVSFDSSKGYGVYYTVLDTSTGLTYICIDSTVGAALWVIDETALIKFKKELTALETYNGGYYDISELPAVTGYAWDIVSATGEVKNLTTLHVGNKAAYILTEGNSAFQFSDSIGEMLTSYGVGKYKLVPGVSMSLNVISSKKMQIRIKGASSDGDGSLTIYGVARLIKL